MSVFGFGKKITLTDDEFPAFMRMAVELAGAVCQENEVADCGRRGAVEFCEANITAADMPTVMNIQGVIDSIAVVEGVSRKAAINSRRLLTTGEKAFRANCSDLGFKGSAKLIGHNIGYCTAFVAAAHSAKRLHKEFGRKAFLVGYENAGAGIN